MKRIQNILNLKLLFFVLLPMFLGLGFAASAQGQDIPKVTFNYSLDKAEYKDGEEAIIKITANVPKDWYIYSSNIECQIGPIPPSLEKMKNFKLVGGFVSVGDYSYTDDVFNCKVAKFKKKVIMTQKITIADASKPISSKFEMQMCSEVTGLCTQLRENISLSFKKAGKAAAVNTSDKDPKAVDPIKDDKDPNATDVQIEKEGNPDSIVDPSAIDSAGMDTLSRDSMGAMDELAVSSDTSLQPIGPFVNNKDYIAKSAADLGQCDTHQKSYNGVTVTDDFNKGGLWGMIILAFLAGLAALITPCVFPMIPMTVTFFLKQSKTRVGAIKNALFFGLCIVVVYMLIGLIFGAAFNDQTINYIATAALPNIIFFSIFMIFAFSFFGAFEITLPASLTTKLDQKADKGGYVGIFFMALTLAVVSFSCTGPIVATVLVQSADGQLIKPLLAMAGFGFALALPFMLAAIFPTMLSSMPKSGGWLNSVKVCLGFIEIAFGLKFLSVADQTYHWGLLDREIYLAIWIALFTLMGLYLMGKMKFSHDSDVKFISIPRLMFIIVTFTFVVYLVPGLWGAPLKGLSGYLPPMSSQDFKLGGKLAEDGNLSEEPMYGDKLEIPHELQGYFDYDQALRCAAEMDKPLFLDFTGHGCVNCRKLEESAWDHPKVLKLLREEYVVVSLYVDDKTIPIPKEEYFISMAYSSDMQDTIKTLGEKNASIQKCLYGILAQPQYVVIDYNQNLLAAPKYYKDLNGDGSESFIKFLKAGVNQFNAKKALAK